jgi:hypothetical protein
VSAGEDPNSPHSGFGASTELIASTALETLAWKSADNGM